MCKGMRHINSHHDDVAREKIRKTSDNIKVLVSDEGEKGLTEWLWCEVY